MPSLIDRYSKEIRGVLSCYDRIVINGTLPGLCFAGGMTSYLYANKIRIFDFSNMETCRTFAPWHDKKTGKTFLRDDSGRCLHYYFYFIDEHLGLCYLRVPTWAPFRLQFYFNGHAWLAARLKKKNISFTLQDNAFTQIADWNMAQKIADDLDVQPIHRALDRFAKLYGPARLPVSYHWSVMQAEYATDIVFNSSNDLKPLYDTLVRTAVHAVKADNVATFLGKKLSLLYEGELGNNFHTRIEGTRIKHHMGPASIKMYDKFGHILRIESTTNDLSFFRHARRVEQDQARPIFKIAPLKKSIYSLAPDLQQLLAASNACCLAFLSDLDDPTSGIKALQKISASTKENDRPYKGYNLFLQEDQNLFETLLRGEYLISGLRNKDLRFKLLLSTSQVSHALKRLRLHGLIKRIGKTYKYYLTDFGRRVAVCGLKLKELYIIPQLSYSLPS